jgi:hypothetical protein
MFVAIRFAVAKSTLCNEAVTILYPFVTRRAITRA